MEGGCPSQQDVSSALEAAGVSMEATPGLSVEVRSRAGRAVLEVRDEERGQLLVREVRSEDCGAVAEVFALILLDAASLAPPPAEVSEVDSVAEASSSSPARPAPRPPLSKQEAGPGLSLGLLGGFGGTPSTSSKPLYLQVDAGYELDAFWLRGALSLSSASSIGEELQRQPYSARVELARELVGPPVWTRLSGGLALVASSLRSEDASRVDMLRVHPALSCGVSAGLVVSESLSIRSEVYGLWFPVRDRYTSAMGPVGESPRASAALGLGLEWRLGL